MHKESKLFSAYWLDPSYEWCATHRLSLDSAIFYCKQYRRNPAHLDCPVVIVPDGEDPAPYLEKAEWYSYLRLLEATEVAIPKECFA